jgi:hypothetical protein
MDTAGRVQRQVRRCLIAAAGPVQFNVAKTEAEANRGRRQVVSDRARAAQSPHGHQGQR